MSLTIPSSNVVSGSDARFIYRVCRSVTGGIAAGTPVFVSSARAWPAEWGSTDLEMYRGMAVCSAAINQPIAIQTGGHISFSSATTATKGEVHVVGAGAYDSCTQTVNGAPGLAVDVAFITETSTRVLLARLNTTAITT